MHQANGRFHHPSFWVDTLPGPEFYSRLPEGGVDVVILGSGMAGLLSATMIAKTGRSVAVLDSGLIASGSHGRMPSYLTTLHGLSYAAIEEDHGYSASEAYAMANMEAVEDLVSMIENLDIDCDLEKRPSFTYASDASSISKVGIEVDACKKLGISAKPHRAEPLDSLAAVKVDDQFCFNPRKLLLGLANKLSEAGNFIQENIEVFNITEDGDRKYTLWLSEGNHLDADAVVMTDESCLANPLISDMIQEQTVHSLVMETGGRYLPGMYTTVGKDVIKTITPTEQDDNQLILLTGEASEPDTSIPAMDAWSKLEEWGRLTLKARRPLWRWSSTEYRSTDGFPIIGRVEDGSDIYCATGFCEWEASGGMVAARIIADAMTGKRNEWAWAFDPSRDNMIESDESPQEKIKLVGASA